MVDIYSTNKANAHQIESNSALEPIVDAITAQMARKCATHAEDVRLPIHVR